MSTKKEWTKDDFFVPEHHHPECDQEHLSPSGKYKLTTQTYNTSKTTGSNSWNYTRGLVTNAETGEEIADVRRNYSSFWHLWFEQGEKEYLLCGEDYQGYGAVDLEQKTVKFFLPESAEQGVGFCWVEAEQTDPDRILVNGCYWACPFEYVEYDVSDPMNLPYPELSRYSDDDDYEDDDEDEEDEDGTTESA